MKVVNLHVRKSKCHSIAGPTTTARCANSDFRLFHDYDDEPYLMGGLFHKEYSWELPCNIPKLLLKMSMNNFCSITLLLMNPKTQSRKLTSTCDILQIELCTLDIIFPASISRFLSMAEMQFAVSVHNVF